MLRRCAFFLSAGSLLFFLIVVPSPRAADLSYARIVRLAAVIGDVQISRPGHTNWEPAYLNMPVTQGVSIGTNDGRAEIEFENGAVLWIGENTLVQFSELALSDGGRITKMTLAQGTISADARLKSGDTFLISTASEQVSVPKNAFFRMDAFHDGASVSVFEGAVQLNNPSGASSGARILPKGQTFAYKNNSSAKTAVASNPKPDTWDRWVAQFRRVDIVETQRAFAYTNAPFTYGLEDLGAYGAWNFFPGFGYGWQPTGMNSCWMPFTAGQWGFYPGFGWTWISAEPWGWVPYHFGSWDYMPGNGWTWFPGDYGFWSPATVNWYNAGNQVAWWPMASPASFGMEPAMFTGCSGGSNFGGFNFAVTKLRPVSPNSKLGVGHKLPLPPRLLLTENSKQLGHGRIRVAAFGGAEGTMERIPGGPLVNGKLPRGSDLAAFTRGGASLNARVVVPTAASMSHLQNALRLSGATHPVQMRAWMPAMPSIRTLRANNGMISAPRMPRPPARMSFEQRTAAFGASGWSGRGGASRSSSASGFSMRGGAGSMGAPAVSHATSARTSAAPSRPH